jgi:hypothetical protein
MGRLRAASLLLAALAVGLLLAACGGGNGELLPGTTADQITSNLNQVRESVNEGNCEQAEDAVVEVMNDVDALQKVDAQLKSALKQGAAKLSEVVSTCSAEEETENAAAEAEEQEQLEAESAEEEAFEKEQKAEEREEKSQEKAEKKAEQPGPPEEGEESGKGKGKESQEETVETPSESEVTPPSGEGGPAGGIGPSSAVEGGG